MNVKEKLQWIKNLDGKGRANCITNDNKKKNEIVCEELKATQQSKNFETK